MNEDDKVECKRCGKCCHFNLGKAGVARCKYLRDVGSNQTVCAVYNGRIGIRIIKNPLTLCKERFAMKKNFVGCPFNRPEWGEELEYNEVEGGVK